MANFFTKYDQQFKFYCKSSTSAIFGSSSKTRKRFTQNEKEVRLHYSINGNFAETAKVFGINESTVRGMVKARPVPDNIKLSSKCYSPGKWRPLIFPVELDDEILTWILALWGLHFSVSVLRFQKKAKLLIQLHNPSFSANCVGLINFSLNTTLLCKPVFQSPKNCCIPLHLLVKWLKHQQRPHQNVLRRKVTECVVRSSGSEKKYLTVLLAATAYGQMLPLMIIFRGKLTKLSVI